MLARSSKAPIFRRAQLEPPAVAFAAGSGPLPTTLGKAYSAHTPSTSAAFITAAGLNEHVLAGSLHVAPMRRRRRIDSDAAPPTARGPSAPMPRSTFSTKASRLSAGAVAAPTGTHFDARSGVTINPPPLPAPVMLEPMLTEAEAGGAPAPLMDSRGGPMFMVRLPVEEGSASSTQLPAENDDGLERRTTQMAAEGESTAENNSARESSTENGSASTRTQPVFVENRVLQKLQRWAAGDVACSPAAQRLLHVNGHPGVGHLTLFRELLPRLLASQYASESTASEAAGSLGGGAAAVGAGAADLGRRDAVIAPTPGAAAAAGGAGSATGTPASAAAASESVSSKRRRPVIFHYAFPKDMMPTRAALHFAAAAAAFTARIGLQRRVMLCEVMACEQRGVQCLQHMASGMEELASAVKDCDGELVIMLEQPQLPIMTAAATLAAKIREDDEAGYKFVQHAWPQEREILALERMLYEQAIGDIYAKCVATGIARMAIAGGASLVLGSAIQRCQIRVPGPQASATQSDAGSTAASTAGASKSAAAATRSDSAKTESSGARRGRPRRSDSPQAATAQPRREDESKAAAAQPRREDESKAAAAQPRREDESKAEAALAARARREEETEAALEARLARHDWFAGQPDAHLVPTSLAVCTDMVQVPATLPAATTRAIANAIIAARKEADAWPADVRAFITGEFAVTLLASGSVSKAASAAAMGPGGAGGAAAAAAAGQGAADATATDSASDAASGSGAYTAPYAGSLAMFAHFVTEAMRALADSQPQMGGTSATSGHDTKSPCAASPSPPGSESSGEQDTKASNVASSAVHDHARRHDYAASVISADEPAAARPARRRPVVIAEEAYNALLEATAPEVMADLALGMREMNPQTRAALKELAARSRSGNTSGSGSGSGAARGSSPASGLEPAAAVAAGGAPSTPAGSRKANSKGPGQLK